ncbi:PREDICTED: cytochrome c oxidase assembly factor 4 homolog, mitochondrial [Cyphomyrmex costatus]|uniref:Coiled-coil-helix-coiled-coil-helix domain-containing protein 8 n=1 Tax=Cyphomyrmex costatus TaxID=456900 RepID=A0A195CLA5_9HYME|nr:PREDICTED: cytochrome c oxidase assembly factor 4 homolog, mitochondrial [Cyphomyrmex costatus]XP_018396848.1 PREDICTED: cytochrome c oxidase assembly factor 4 homolog, mitochondrial [Cyphomyrmex costatus]KYN01483.1 Coiled-coil-helix-coiled-coil-helix domain-containing protein 8 [Cyphomyrmex costatus]
MTTSLNTGTEKEIEDPVERILKKTGCIELHYQVQECIAEHQDWRKCQNEVKKFKECMAKHTKQQEQRY